MSKATKRILAKPTPTLTSKFKGYRFSYKVQMFLSKSIRRDPEQKHLALRISLQRLYQTQ